jgi:hypothetical protein
VVERLLHTQEVAGSNPASRTIFIFATKEIRPLNSHRRFFYFLILLFACFAFARVASAKDEKSIKRFTEAIIALAPGVDPAEAAQVSVTAHHTSRQLAREYRVVGPPPLQNFLIHLGVRKRGYCYHWAYDIGTRLKEIRLKTLELHWGASDEGTRLESNCLVVTARGQAFADGYIMDAWRNAGRLCWWPVRKDSAYLWKENSQLTAWLQNSERAKPQSPRTSEVANRDL